MEPTEEARSRAPGLADATVAVEIADDDRTRDGVFRFRHSVYVDELKRGVDEVDEDHRLLRDQEDDELATTLLYTAEDGSVGGTARVCGWAPGAAPSEVQSRFSMERFPGLAQLGTAEIGRVMLRRDCRGHFGLSDRPNLDGVGSSLAPLVDAFYGPEA